MAITRKHSELTGSSLHDPKGIVTTPSNTADSLVEINITSNAFNPVDGGAVDLGQSTEVSDKQFRNLYISGEIYKGSDLFTGGGTGTGTGIFTQTGSYYSAPSDLQVTGSLFVTEEISGSSITFESLDVSDSGLFGGTVTASA